MFETIQELLRRYQGLDGCDTALAKLRALLERAGSATGVVTKIALQKEVEALARELEFAAAQARQLVPVVREEDAQAVRRLSLELGRTPIEPEERAPLPEPVKVPPAIEEAAAKSTSPPADKADEPPERIAAPPVTKESDQDARAEAIEPAAAQSGQGADAQRRGGEPEVSEPRGEPATEPSYTKNRRRTSPIDPEASHPFSSGFKELPNRVFLEARVASNRATASEDRVAGMSALLALETPEDVKATLDRDLVDFACRSKNIAAAVSGLGPAEAAAYEEGLKAACLESLFAMSDTCSGASAATDRGRLAKQYYQESFEKITDEGWRNACMKTSRQGGRRLPLLGGTGTRFMEINLMLNKGADMKGRSYEPGVFGEPREEGDEANVRHFVESSPQDVDGSITTVPGGKPAKSNVKNISLFVEEYIERKPEDVNPIEVLAKQYQAEVSNHGCPNGNGRSALLNLMATALDLGLPMPLMTKEGTKMIHAMGEQVAAEDNMSPVDAMAAVAQGIDRMLAVQTDVLASVGVNLGEVAPAVAAATLGPAIEAQEPNATEVEAESASGEKGAALAIEGWDAARESALRPLRDLIGALRGLGDSEADEIARIAQTVLEKLDVPITSAREADDIKTYLSGAKEVPLVESANQFGISIDLRGPLERLFD